MSDMSNSRSLNSEDWNNLNRNGEERSDKAYYKKIGKIIRHNLEAAGISEEQAAEVVGLSPYLFKKILNGYMGINVSEIKNICDNLNINYKLVLAGEEPREITIEKDPLDVVSGLIYEYMKLEWRSLNGERK